MSRWHCRCRHCDARRVLAKHPDCYVRRPRCHLPGCPGKMRVDRWMQYRNTSPRRGGLGCTCGGYWFTHRRGSLRCWYRRDGTWRQPGDADFKGWSEA